MDTPTGQWIAYDALSDDGPLLDLAPGTRCFAYVAPQERSNMDGTICLVKDNGDGTLSLTAPFDGMYASNHRDDFDWADVAAICHVVMQDITDDLLESLLPKRKRITIWHDGDTVWEGHLDRETFDLLNVFQNPFLVVDGFIRILDAVQPDCFVIGDREPTYYMGHTDDLLRFRRTPHRLIGSAITGAKFLEKQRAESLKQQQRDAERQQEKAVRRERKALEMKMAANDIRFDMATAKAMLSQYPHLQGTQAEAEYDAYLLTIKVKRFPQRVIRLAMDTGDLQQAASTAQQEFEAFADKKLIAFDYAVKRASIAAG